MLDESRVRALRRQLDLQSARLCAEVTLRPWGALVHNSENPGYYDANRARVVAADDPAAVVEEIARFYQARGLVPRAKFNEDVAPPDLARHFEARGFHCGRSAFRVMTWTGSAPATVAPEGYEIVIAGPGDREALVAVQRETEGTESVDWLRRKLNAFLAAPAIRYYLARADGAPAACAMLLQGPEVGLIEDVATVPAYRRRGLAAALIARIQQDATSPLLLDVEDEGAERIYTRAGFHVLAEVEEWTCSLPGAME